MAKTITLTSPTGVRVTASETAADNLTRMGYRRTEDTAEAQPKPKRTTRKASTKTPAKTPDPAPSPPDEETPTGSGPFG